MTKSKIKQSTKKRKIKISMQEVHGVCVDCIKKKEFGTSANEIQILQIMTEAKENDNDY